MNTLKKTRGREAILHVLETEQSPVDVSHIQTHLSEKAVSIDPATVYRILDTFYKNGIVHRFEFHEGKFRYELSSKEDHHHLICESCGTIEDISDCDIPRLEKDIQKKQRFLVKHHSLEFFGVCRSCQR
jgi:Fur family ferric uptake transcriptional regulator